MIDQNVSKILSSFEVFYPIISNIYKTKTGCVSVKVCLPHVDLIFAFTYLILIKS